jgi:hypothetical protein
LKYCHVTSSSSLQIEMASLFRHHLGWHSVMFWFLYTRQQHFFLSRVLANRAFPPRLV